MVLKSTEQKENKVKYEDGKRVNLREIYVNKYINQGKFPIKNR